MKYRIEVQLNEDGAQNVVLYYEKLSDGFAIVKGLLDQGYVLKITGECDE